VNNTTQIDKKDKTDAHRVLVADERILYNAPMPTTLDTLLALHSTAPAAWTAGAPFAYRGRTPVADNNDAPFTAIYAAVPYGLIFYTPRTRLLEIMLPAPAAPRLVLPHLYAAEAPRGPLIVTWANPQTIIGILPAGGGLALRCADGPEADFRAPFWVSADPAAADAVVLAMGRGGHFVLAYDTGSDAVEQAGAAARTTLLDADAWAALK
jgi:hypothetical protein